MRPKCWLRAAAMLGALYGIAACSDNSRDLAGVCDGALETAQALEPFARGDLAAFQIAEEPRRLSDITFTGPDGAVSTLADWEGRNVLLNLWATWCAPCREEMPALDALQREEGGDDFEVVALNVDAGGSDRPQTFLDEIGVDALRLYRDPSADAFESLKARGYGIGLPITVLVDDSGCALGHVAGPASWNGDDAKALVRAASGAGS